MAQSLDSQSLDLVRAIHDADVRACLVVTGGGVSAINALFAVAGASRTVIDAQVPYSRTALDDYLGERAERHVSADEALMMARKAYVRAKTLDAERDPPAAIFLGVSCTAAIATDRLRRGENRCHVATFNGATATSYSITMQKGARDRAEEEAICASLILNTIANACGLELELEVKLLDSECIIVESD